MARRRDDQAPGPGDVTIEHDPVSEQILLAAAFVDDDARSKLAKVFQTDHFFEPKHRDAWAGVLELERRKLDFGFKTLKKLSPKADISYLKSLVQDRPESPENLDFHIDRLQWDHARMTAIQGPVRELVDAIHDPLADPERVRALARQVVSPFEGYEGRNYLRDSADLVREMMADIEVRSKGIESYSYGIDRLDYHEDPDEDGNPRRRMVPGAAPGRMTVITGLRGVGKSTLAARLALGLARNHKKVLYGAWEMEGKMTMELLACMSLGMDRSRFFLPHDKGGVTPEEKIRVEEKAHGISHYIRFLEEPFHRKRGENRSKGGNQRNLDIIHQYIEDTGCEIFIADLWKRCLVETKPEDEEHALQRQQSMLKECRVHGILVHQQLTKGEQVRADKRPTLENSKGSAMWGEAPDTVIGPHRPGAYKAVDDNIMELIILKQRFGIAPQTVEFEWDGKTGLLTGGKTVDYVADGGGSSSGIDTFLFGGNEDKKKGRR